MHACLWSVDDEWLPGSVLQMSEKVVVKFGSRGEVCGSSRSKSSTVL